jgi:hypothetical protein
MDAATVILLLLLLACPLGMFFMHRRGGHGAHARDPRTTAHGSHPAAQHGHAGHGCGHIGYGRSWAISEPVPARDDRKAVDLDSSAR